VSGSWPSMPDDAVRTVEPATLLARLRSGPPVRVVHAGSAGSFREGHVPGAVRASAPVGIAGALGAGEQVVVYGPAAHDPRAALVAGDLAEALGRPVWWLRAGLPGWAAAGGGVEGSAADGVGGAPRDRSPGTVRHY
jgi:rhodanese-related sulfurtransferase